MNIVYFTKLSLFPLVFFLFLQAPFVYTLTYTGLQIRDLERNDTCFIQEAANWTASSTSPGQAIYSQCSGTYLLGGYQVLGTGSQSGDSFYITYTNLPAHTMVYFSLTMWAIDNWHNDDFTIDVGSRTFLSWNNFDKSNFIDDYCGGGSKDLKDIRIFGIAAHSGALGSSLTFKIISWLSQQSGNRAFGVRDLELIFASPFTAYTEHMCGRAAIPITTNQCACNPGYYSNAGVCTLCDPSCASCFGSGPSQCYACKKGYSFDGTSCFGCDISCSSCYGLTNTECSSCQSGYLLFQNHTCIPASSCVSPLLQTSCNTYCESPCSNVNDFLYWNGSCLSSCSFPHQQTTVLSSLKVCVYPCESSEYLYWDGTCSAVCNSPLLTRVEGGKNYCDYPCPITEFLYWNGVCDPNCLSPLTQGNIGGRQFCYYLCANNEYLYWDGSCSSSCNSPLVTRTDGGKNFCDYPCLTGQYLYWDGTCAPTCPYPYHQKTEWGSDFCNHPCPGTQYLYWDAVCESSCPPPLVSSSIGLKNYCNSPCASNQYLYWNTTCLSSCDAPLIQSFRAEVNYCIYPCNAGEYLYMNSSCINNCKLPFTPRLEAGKDYCDPICLNNTELFKDGTCISSCDSPLRYSTNASGTYCDSPCSSPLEYYYEGSKQCKTTCDGTPVLGGLFSICVVTGDGIEPIELSLLLHHIRYLDIKLPPKLQSITDNRQMNILSMRVVSSTFSTLRIKILQATRISTFEKYIFPNSFLANLLDELMLMGIILSLGIFFAMLELISKLFQWFYPQIIFERLRVLILWNLFLVLMTVNAGDIIFFASIELRSVRLTSLEADISFFLCLLMVFGVLAIYVLNFYVVYKIQDFKTKAMKTNVNDVYTDYLLKWESAQVLFRGFQDNTIITHAFYLIYGLRLFLPMAVASFLSMIPILQSIFYILISLAAIGFLLRYKPIKNKLNQANLVLLEIIIFIVNVCVFIMALFDLTGVGMYGGYVFFGDVIIAMNFCINLLALTFLPIKIIDGIKYALVLRRKCASEELGAWLQLLFIPIQQGGLGFEQVQLVSAFTVSRIKTRINKKRTLPSKKTKEDGDPLFKPLSAQPLWNQRLDPTKETSLGNGLVASQPLEVSRAPQIFELMAVEVEPQPVHKYKKRKFNTRPKKSIDIDSRSEMSLDISARPEKGLDVKSRSEKSLDINSKPEKSLDISNHELEVYDEEDSLPSRLRNLGNVPLGVSNKEETDIHRRSILSNLDGNLDLSNLMPLNELSFGQDKGKSPNNDEELF